MADMNRNDDAAWRAAIDAAPLASRSPALVILWNCVEAKRCTHSPMSRTCGGGQIDEREQCAVVFFEWRKVRAKKAKPKTAKETT